MALRCRADRISINNMQKFSVFSFEFLVKSMSAWSIFLKTRNAKLKTADEAGQVLIAVVILFTAILTTVIVGLVSPILSQVQMAKNLQQSKQSVFAAESLAEDLAYRFKTGKQVSASESLEVGGAEATASVTTGGGMQTITVNGDYFDLERSITISLSQGSGIAFNYGLQAGNGGISLTGGSSIEGNVYANGSIDAINATISGTVVAADSVDATIAANNDSPSTPTNSINFRNVSASQDFAQSFQVSTSSPLNMMRLYMKRVGWPSDITVRLVTNSGSSPSTNNISIGDVGIDPGQVTSAQGWAVHVEGESVSGQLYCTVGNFNNKACDASRGTPPALPMPFSDANIAEWKAEAETGGTHTGDYSIGWQGATLGPLKITGSLSIAGGGTLTITGPVWVQGNISLGGGGDITLPSTSLGRSVMLIADGRITINGGGQVLSESNGSYLFMVSTSECPNAVGCSSNPAISIAGGGGAIAVNAQGGTVPISGGAHLNAITANHISISGGGSGTYDEGLASPEFVGGPAGGYTISGWGEVE